MVKIYTKVALGDQLAVNKNQEEFDVIMVKTLTSPPARTNPRNFEDGWERDGASLAVFINGTKVIDLWGGYADRQSARKWKQVRTLSPNITRSPCGVQP
ncbi:hypothetical protein COOONC_19024 [Cooperia oncophora]